MKLRIKITKEILRRSMMCGATSEVKPNTHKYMQNCAIALACKDIFDDINVSNSSIFVYPNTTNNSFKISLPDEAKNFIKKFDALMNDPQARLEIPPFEFEVEIDDKLIDHINIEDLKKSETLELCK